MERWIIAGFFLLILVLAFWEGRRAEEARRRQRQRRCRERWGQVPEREYSYEEFFRIPHYYQKIRGGGGVDEATWNDLDMDSVFRMLNHTFSSVGEEYLYALLRTPINDPAELSRRGKKIAWFRENKEEALHLQEIYSRMGYARRIALSDYLFSLPEAPDISLVTELLFLAGILVSLLLFLSGVNGAGAVFFILIAVNIVRYYRVKGSIENRFSGIAYLVGMTGYAEEIAALPMPALEDLSAELKRSAAPFAACRPWAGLIALGNGIGGSFADMLMDYIRIIFHIDFLGYARVIHVVKTHEEELKKLMELLGYLESCLAAASFRDSLPESCDPLLSAKENPEIRAEGLYHPLLDNPVANDFATARPVLVTGSNASGKSTFLKTLAISAILAQTLYTVPARRYEGTYVQVISSMEIKDHLQEGESYFVAEIKSIRRMFEKGNGLPKLLFIDEVLKGTNTVERIAASAEILKSLAVPGSLPFAATHDIELTSLLEESYENYHFAEEYREDDVHFSFHILPGPADTRNAIRLLKLMGYSQDIVERAEERAMNFLKTGVWQKG